MNFKNLSLKQLKDYREEFIHAEAEKSNPTNAGHWEIAKFNAMDSRHIVEIDALIRVKEQEKIYENI